MSATSSKDTAIFGLELQARALVPVGKPESLGNTNTNNNNTEDFVHRFAVATASARGGNNISLIEYQEGRKVAECSAVWNHPQEVLHLSVSPRFTTISDSLSRYLVATIHPASASSSSSSSAPPLSPMETSTRKAQFLPGLRQVSFFDLPDSEDEGLHEMRPLTTLSIDAAAGGIHYYVNNQIGGEDQQQQRIETRIVARNGDISILNQTLENIDDEENITTLSPDFGCLFINNTSTGKQQQQQQQQTSADGQKSRRPIVVTAVCWNRDNTCIMGVSTSMTAITSHLVKVELTYTNDNKWSCQTSLIAKNAHTGTIRVIVNSLGRLHSVLTGGDDGRVCGWDLMTSSSSTAQQQPLFSVVAHHHYIYDISINEDQPELFLSCGADRCTKLWRVPCLSAAHSPSSVATSPVRQADKDEVVNNDNNNETKQIENLQQQQQQQHCSDVICIQHSPMLSPADTALMKKSNNNSQMMMRDSVCSVCWSGTWVYSSCSFEGNVFVDQVPFEMRSQLLLSM